MPRSGREQLLKNHQQALNDMRRAMKNMVLMSEKYGDDYPEYRMVVENCTLAIDELSKVWIQFKEEMM